MKRAFFLLFILLAFSCKRDPLIEPVQATFVPTTDSPIIFSFYPNPVSTDLNVVFDLYYPSSCSIEIYNVFGKLILKSYKNYEKGKQMVSFDCSSFQNGIYFVRTSVNGKQQKIQKVIKN